MLRKEMKHTFGSPPPPPPTPFSPLDTVDRHLKTYYEKRQVAGEKGVGREVDSEIEKIILKKEGGNQTTLV